MEVSQSQLCSIPSPLENPPTPSSSMPHSDHRHSLVAGRLKDALFSAILAKYAPNDIDNSLHFPSEQLKSDIERRLHEYFPSFHTPTHLPYASMIQKAISELGEEDGLSEESISEFIMNEYEDLPWAHPMFLRRHLGKLCESGELVKLKCGRYNFNVEDKGVKRKKRRKKMTGRSRCLEVESADVIEEDFDRKIRSKKLIIIGPRANEVVTSKSPEEQNDTLREVIVGVEHGDHVQEGQVMLDEHKEVQEDEMIDEHHEEEIKNQNGPIDFDWQKQSQNLVIIDLSAPSTIKGIESQSALGEIREAKVGDHAKGDQIQVLSKPKEARPDVTTGQHLETKQSQNVASAKLGAHEALTMMGTEETLGLSKEEIGGAKIGGHDHETQVIMIYKLKEVKTVGMINDHCEVDVQSRDEAGDFVGRKQLQDLVVVGLHAEEALTTKGTEIQCCPLREKNFTAEGDCAQATQTYVLDKFKEVEMIGVHRDDERQGEVREDPIESASKGSNKEERPSEEDTWEFFDAISNHDNAVENGVIDAQGCKRLQEENEYLEFFDVRSDHGDIGANEMIGAQPSKGKVLSEVRIKENILREQLLSEVSDDQTVIGEGSRNSEYKYSTSIVASPTLEHQVETLNQVEQGTPITFKTNRNENIKALLPSVIIRSSNSQSPGHRGRGRPRKLKVQETASLLSSSAQDCDQKYLPSNVEGRKTYDPNTGDDTHHLDQQQLKPPKGRGRGRGRPRIVRQDQISVAETFSPSKHLHHPQSPEKRRRGRPPKRKFDEDTISMNISTSLGNGQQ